jgi:hypothetical protein
MWAAYLSIPLLDLAVASIARTLSDTAFPREDRITSQQNAVESVYSQEAAKARIEAGLRSIAKLKPAQIGLIPEENG